MTCLQLAYFFHPQLIANPNRVVLPFSSLVVSFMCTGWGTKPKSAFRERVLGASSLVCTGLYNPVQQRLLTRLSTHNSLQKFVPQIATCTYVIAISLRSKKMILCQHKNKTKRKLEYQNQIFTHQMKKGILNFVYSLY